MRSCRGKHAASHERTTDRFRYWPGRPSGTTAAVAHHPVRATSLALVPALAAAGLAGQGTVEASVSERWAVESVDAAVEQGLAWLAAEQNEKGFWLGLVGAKRRDGYRQMTPIEDQLRAGTGHLGVTAWSGMAFLAGGHLPGRGRYGDVVERSVQATLSCVRENGLITESGTRMYSHAFATLFLAQVYGMSADPRIRWGLEQATHIIVDCQNRHGGWRYNAFTRDSDVSVSVCQLQALRAARNIGIKVPKSTIDRAVEYVKAHRITRGRADGRYYYNVFGRRRGRKSDHYSIQAAAVTSLLSAGVYERELIDPVIDFLHDELPYLAREYPHHYYFWYGNYYAAQVFFHADGNVRKGCFAPYWFAIRDHLLADQEPDGRWLNPEREGPGDAFGTAVACIILQIPKQYLPIFQR